MIEFKQGTFSKNCTTEYHCLKCGRTEVCEVVDGLMKLEHECIVDRVESLENRLKELESDFWERHD